MISSSYNLLKYISDSIPNFYSLFYQEQVLIFPTFQKVSFIR